MNTVIHLTASPFFGGPERQMLELARTFRQQQRAVEVLFASFRENGNARPFLDEVTKNGFVALELRNDMPHLLAAASEFADILRQRKIDLALLHGHKARLVGWLAAKRTDTPIIGVSRGWTTENWKIGLYNRLDKWLHRRMDHVVCVSQGQANKVIASGTPKERISVVHNSIRTERFDGPPCPDYRDKLAALFKKTPQFILGDAGRLSPEKGFDVLIAAVAKLVEAGVSVGLVLFGEGFLLDTLRKQAEALGIADAVVFAGFTQELDRFMPHFDLFVQSSHTEGLPNVLLEAMAARTAVVATEVGGTNEVVVDRQTGLLVPPNQATTLANAIRTLLAEESPRQSMRADGRRRVEEFFTFEAQAQAYWQLLQRFIRK